MLWPCLETLFVVGAKGSGISQFMGHFLVFS